MSRTTEQFACQSCHCCYRMAYSHPTLGPVCPICLRPVRYGFTRPMPAKNRRAKLADRDGWFCHLCESPIDPLAQGDRAPTVDHLLPVSYGGSNELSNLKLAHYACNHERGNALLDTAAVGRHAS